MLVSGDLNSDQQRHVYTRVETSAGQVGMGGMSSICIRIVTMEEKRGEVRNNGGRRARRQEQ